MFDGREAVSAIDGWFPLQSKVDLDDDIKRDLAAYRFPNDLEYRSVEGVVISGIGEPHVTCNNLEMIGSSDGSQDFSSFDEIFDLETETVPQTTPIPDIQIGPTFSVPERELEDQSVQIMNDSTCEDIYDMLLSNQWLREDIPDFIVDFTNKVPENKTLAVPQAEFDVTRNEAERNDVWVVQERFDPVEFEKIRPFLCHVWPFELDEFQKQAILCLDRSECVLVAAHTSAGKTVVAEYAIALTLAHKTRCFYCSPIKALSNQKYREFRRTFGDVGLVTGDVKINPDAGCVIMTTEILRTMLYNRKDDIFNLEYLIFDEVHYVNDYERGMVWEEVFILIPSRVNIVMLSATVSNANEFAQWVGSTKKRPVHLITTPRRPVPLKHYIYTGINSQTQRELFLLQEQDKQFDLSAYSAAKEAYEKRNPHGGCPLSHGQSRQAWLNIIRFLERDCLLPAIAFCFSRAKIDRIVRQVDRLQLNTLKERELVLKYKRYLLVGVPDADKLIDQISFIGDMTERGIGIHHSGLLPILKEYVEYLFCVGLIKLLIATETFAMGVNMPARTVVFADIDKFDGQVWRNLYAGEYIQMSGRAGRRGLDHAGNVIILCQENMPDSEVLQLLINGQPTPLLSKFRLNFNVILNIERNQTFSVLDMVKSSFGQYAEQCSSIINVQKLTHLQSQKQKFAAINEAPLRCLHN
ncbi:hypothetical protein ACOME3_009910 [Neoechinorhynchus agilis]